MNTDNGSNTVSGNGSSDAVDKSEEPENSINSDDENSSVISQKKVNTLIVYNAKTKKYVVYDKNDILNNISKPQTIIQKVKNVNPDFNPSSIGEDVNEVVSDDGVKTGILVLSGFGLVFIILVAGLMFRKKSHNKNNQEG